MPTYKNYFYFFVLGTIRKFKLSFTVTLKKKQIY